MKDVQGGAELTEMDSDGLMVVVVSTLQVTQNQSRNSEGFNRSSKTRPAAAAAAAAGSDALML